MPMRMVTIDHANGFTGTPCAMICQSLEGRLARPVQNKEILKQTLVFR
jgi:hypothetical protein